MYSVPYGSGRRRSVTPPTEVPRLNDPKLIVLRRSVARGYNSSLELSRPESACECDSTASSVQTVIRIVPASGQVTRIASPAAAMFGRVFSRAEGATPAEQEPDIELKGDFDDTPAPSGRPSHADLSAAAGESLASREATLRSPPSRHALLKAFGKLPATAEKETPTAPVLTERVSPPSTALGLRQAAQDSENGILDRSANSSSPAMQKGATLSLNGNLSESKKKGGQYSLRDKEKLVAQLYPTESRQKTSQPGLAKNTGFC